MGVPLSPPANGWEGQGRLFPNISLLASAVQLFRKRDWTFKTRKIFHSFLKKKWRAIQKNVGKIFLF